jgi:hypothetical protein
MPTVSTSTETFSSSRASFMLALNVISRTDYVVPQQDMDFVPEGYCASEEMRIKSSYRSAKTPPAVIYTGVLLAIAGEVTKWPRRLVLT